MKPWTCIFACALVAGVSFTLGTSRGQVTFEEELFDPLVDQRMRARWKLELIQAKPDLRTLAKKRLAAARLSVESRFKEFAAGRTTISDFLLEAQRKMLEAELLVAETKEERVAALENCWYLAKKAEMINEAKFLAGNIGPKDYYPVVIARLEAEYALVKAKGE